MAKSLLLDGMGSETGTEVIPPVVGNLLPASGPLEKHTVVSFDVTDDSGLRQVFVVAAFPSNIKELIHDGTDFNQGYRNSFNTRSAISGGYHYTVRRDQGWTEATVSIEVYAIDTSGNQEVD